MPAGPLPSRKKAAADNDPVVKPRRRPRRVTARRVTIPGSGRQGSDRDQLPAAMAVAKPNVNVDPVRVLSVVLPIARRRPVNPEKLRQMLASLNRLRKPREVHAAILGYLKNIPYHRVPAEPWMYEALAMAIEMNRVPRPTSKRRLNYAADLAQAIAQPQPSAQRRRPALPQGLSRAGGHACWMKRCPRSRIVSSRSRCRSISPRRPRIRSGWPTPSSAFSRSAGPGDDEYLRIEAGQQVDRMVKQLRDENKTAEAELLEKKLQESSSRDVFVRLTWDGYADFDLSVDEPLGVTASYTMPRTVFGGALIKNGYGGAPGRDLRLPPRLQWQVHDPRLQYLGRSQTARHQVDARGDHPRGDLAADEADPEP